MFLGTFVILILFLLTILFVLIGFFLGFSYRNIAKSKVALISAFLAILITSIVFLLLRDNVEYTNCTLDYIEGKLLNWTCSGVATVILSLIFIGLMLLAIFFGLFAGFENGEVQKKTTRIG